MPDPIQVDGRIRKGAVLSTERGLLYVALGRFYRGIDGTANGWHGMGFNGVPARAELPEFVAPSINSYILDTYHEEGTQE